MTNKVDWPRPDKRDIFLLLACISSLPSPDSQTQCGCVITTLDNRVLGTGYNGFPRGINNDIIPNVRPDKYDWVEAGHSERNAVNNCILSPRFVGGGVAYVTGRCCSDCTQHLWNNGVETIYEVIGFNDPVMCKNGEDEERKRNLVYKLAQSGKTLDIIKVNPDMIGPVFHKDTLVKILKLFASKGFDFDLNPDFEETIFVPKKTE